MTLPFQSVGEIVEFQDGQCQHGSSDDAHRWLKIQAARYLRDGNNYYHVDPLHIVAFTAVPGEGSEPANIGLARFPAFINIDRDGKKRRFRTALTGWSWSSFCKTQYASDKAFGGTANFVRCHMSIVALLDAIQKHAKVEVDDESEYWDHRDAQKLAEVVGDWNEMIAAVAGQFKDADPERQIEAPITQFGDFEHLEAKGRDKLKTRPS